jgi:hypothetical protein
LTSGKWVRDLSAATPLADAALRVLDARLAVVRDYLRLALREHAKDPEDVHQLRVGTRRAGAALDIFVACLPERAYTRALKQLRRLRRAAGATGMSSCWSWPQPGSTGPPASVPAWTS